MAQDMDLIDFLVELNRNQTWQRWFDQYNRGVNQKWKDLVERSLSDADAALILSEDQAAIEAKVAAQKDSTHTVWLNSTVWQ